MHWHLSAARYTAKPPAYLRCPDLIYELCKAKGWEGQALLPLECAAITQGEELHGERGEPVLFLNKLEQK